MRIRTDCPFLTGGITDHDDLGVRPDRLADVDLRLRDLLALQRLDRERLARVEEDGGRVRRRAPLAHDVDVLVRALLRLRVVVVQAEGVRLRRLEEVDDVAVLGARSVSRDGRPPARAPRDGDASADEDASEASRALTARASSRGSRATPRPDPR